MTQPQTEAQKKKAAQQRAEKKADAEKTKLAKLAEGTTKPLPTNEETPEQIEAQKQSKILAAKIKKLQEELKKERDKEKTEAKIKKEAKEKEREGALAERVKKQGQIEEADSYIKRCEESLHKTEEWQELHEALTTREKIGPLPKVRKSGGGKGKTRGGAAGLTNKMIRLLEALQDGDPQGSAALAEVTGIQKGKPFPLMEEMGLIESLTEENVRGKLFQILDYGLEKLEEAKKEMADKVD